MTHDMWHVTCDTHDRFVLLFWFLVLVLLSAHIERLSVSHTRGFMLEGAYFGILRCTSLVLILMWLRQPLGRPSNTWTKYLIYRNWLKVCGYICIDMIRNMHVQTNVHIKKRKTYLTIPSPRPNLHIEFFLTDQFGWTIMK